MQIEAYYENFSIRDGELRELLRACRRRIDPRALGYPRSRRGQGLTQAQAALASDVSARRYQDFEERRARPTAEQVDKIAAGMRLTSAERSVLYELSVGERRVCPMPDAPADGEMQEIVRRHEPRPTAMVDPAGYYLAWNSAYARWFHDPAALPPELRNVIAWLFTARPEHRITTLGQLRHQALGWFRFNFASHPEEPQFHRVIDALLAHPEGMKLWRRYYVRPSLPSRHLLPDPQTGRLVELQICAGAFPTGEYLVELLPPFGEVTASPHPSAA